MKFHQTFPVCYLLNLARRGDRRAQCEWLFEEFGLSVERFPAVDAINVRDFRGFEAPGRYAHAISTRMIIREAKRNKVPAVFIFEDDVLLHPQFHELLDGIDLPDDWGMFYLGAQHHARPEVVAPGLVRMAGGLDTHAWGVRAEYYDLVLRALAGKVHPAPRETPAADVLLAKLQSQVPSYAAFPNLAWQMEGLSDLGKVEYSNYRMDGTQKWAEFFLDGLCAESQGVRSWIGLNNLTLPDPFFERWYKALPPDPEEASTEPDHQVDLSAYAIDRNPRPPVLTADGKIAFLFLTVGEQRHPRIWEEYWRGGEDRISVYAHTKGRAALGEGWSRDAQIGEEIETEWGDISLLRAQMALLRAALEDGRNQFFVFASESCLPLRPLDELRRLVSVDGRSRFAYQTFEEVEVSSPEKVGRVPRTGSFPASYCRFHSQWVFLNRELASLVLEDDLTEQFADVFSADESYVGSVANLKGYPLKHRVAKRNLTWTEWEAPGTPNPVSYQKIDPGLIGDLAASGCYFARKFDAACDLSDYRLHLPPESR